MNENLGYLAAKTILTQEADPYSYKDEQDAVAKLKAAVEKWETNARQLDAYANLAFDGRYKAEVFGNFTSPAPKPPAPKPLRYILHAGYVTSQSGGDRHYITPNRLSDLYFGRLKSLNVAPDGRRILYVDERNGYGLGVGSQPGDIHLYPRSDGDYSLPRPGWRKVTVHVDTYLSFVEVNYWAPSDLNAGTKVVIPFAGTSTGEIVRVGGNVTGSADEDIKGVYTPVEKSPVSKTVPVDNRPTFSKYAWQADDPCRCPNCSSLGCAHHKAK